MLEPYWSISAKSTINDHHNLNNMINIKSYFVLSLCFGSLALTLSCNPASKTSSLEENKDEFKASGQAYVKDADSAPNALNLAINSNDHTVLVKAVQAAEVENALVNVGPLTVFAPNNEAFSKIEETALNDLLKPENKSQLAFILTNHVAPSNYPIETLRKNAEKNRLLYMASGKYLKVSLQGDNVYIDGKKILASIKVSNGWVHVIDEILLPSN